MMSNNRVLPTARRSLMLSAAFALGFALTAQAQSQSDHPAVAPSPASAATEPAAAAPWPGSAPGAVEGVTVKAARPGFGVPAEKATAYDAEAAKNEAFRKYRKSTPPLTGDPNDDSKDFPGLQTYIPK